MAERAGPGRGLPLRATELWAVGVQSVAFMTDLSYGTGDFLGMFGDFLEILGDFRGFNYRKSPFYSWVNIHYCINHHVQ